MTSRHRRSAVHRPHLGAWLRRLGSALLVAALAALLAGTRLAAAGGDGGQRELVVLTWSEYVDPELVARFEREHDVRVRFVYFVTDEDRDDIMLAADGRGFDLILVNGASVGEYVSSGWLAPIDVEALANHRHLDPRWLGAFPDTAAYGVPYFWGTVGIGYRRDLVPEGFSSWRDLLEPDEALRGRIIMVKDTRDLLGVALKALGHSLNATEPAALEGAEALLLAQKDYVQSYSYVSLSEQSALVTGDAWAATLYNGDALVLQEVHPEIDFVVPREGSILWIDYFTVPRAAREPELAHAFLDLLNEPEAAAANARYVYYPTPNRAAEAHLPAEFFEDSVIYPDAETISRSEFHAQLPPRTQRKANAIFARVVN